MSIETIGHWPWCPHIIRKRAGDETYDICELNTKSCLIEHGLYTCEIWEEIKAEWEKEAPRQKTLGDVLIETAKRIRIYQGRR